MKYLIYTLIITVLVTAGIYSFVVTVDPYDVYGFNLLNYKYKAVRSARNSKFNYIDNHRKKFKTVVIGSSRAERFNPDIFGKCFEAPAYNYSVENANAEDLLTITKHLIETQHPKTIVMFVDFYMFNGYIGYDRRFMRSPLISYLKEKPRQLESTHTFTLPYWHQSYLSTRGLFDALQLTLKKFNNEKYPPIYLGNGQHVIEESTKEPHLATAYFSHQYKNFRPDDERLEMFKEIKKLTDENHIMVRVVLTPMMKKHYDKLLADPLLAKNFHLFRKEMTRLFGQIVDFNNEDVEQFQQREKWYDTVHPTEILTEIMAPIICGTAPAQGKFGRIIHP
ncbi:hypothetical protein KAH37_04400 [bacterium]|nr:hypothetical protein [bacterium]